MAYRSVCISATSGIARLNPTNENFIILHPVKVAQVRTCRYFYAQTLYYIIYIMTLAVRFRFAGAKTPTFDIVELSNDQWREFFWLERSKLRMEWMIRFLHYEYIRHEIKELWWIPLDDQEGLQIVSPKIRK